MAVELATAYISLVPSFKGGTAAIQKEAADMGRATSDAMADEVTKAGSKSGSIGSAFTGVAVAGAAIFAGVKMLGGFIKEAEEAAAVSRQTEAVLKSTGAQAGVTAKSVDTLATALSNKSGIDDEVIASGQNVLLTFTQIKNAAGEGNDVFDQATAIALDMSVAMGTDLQGSILQVGKALNDPIKGMGALAEVGVSFTAQQREQVEAMIASGDTMGAQQLIIAELNKEFAGSAEAGATASAKMGVLWGNIQETIGTALMPAFAAVTGWLMEALPAAVEIGATAFDAVKNALQWVIDNKPVLAGVLTAIALGLTLWAVGAASAAAASIAAGVAAAAAWIVAAAPVVAVVAAIAAVVAGFVLAYEKVDWFRAGVDAVVAAVVAAGQWLVEAWTKYSDDIGRGLQDAGAVVAEVFGAIVSAVRTAIDVVGQIISAGVDAFKLAWGPISTLFDIWKSVYIDPVVWAVEQMIGLVVGIISVGIDTIKAIWGGIQAVVSFFQDNVAGPLGTIFTTMKDSIVGTITAAVTGVQTAWQGLRAVYTWFVDNIYNPISEKVGDLRDGIGNAFAAAVEAVKTAWGMLQDVVKVPINLVIGFYNSGIVAVWNAVISKIPGLGDLSTITQLNKGGTVPGAGNRDTVPAMLTPGEFVITKDAARAWGPGLLELLNKGPHGTVDPAVFGYAQGGPVKSIEETQAWMQQQAGKAYQFPDAGPESFDCSGFTSALINFVLGQNPPWGRRHSSGSVGSDGALQAGAGTANGLIIGARPPYMTNSSGDFVGHVTATVGGLNAEATPPAVRVGGHARGAFDLPEQYFMPGFGELSEEDKGIVKLVQTLKDLVLPDLGGPPMGDMLSKLFADLPKRVFDFLMDKLPGIIVDAVKGAAVGVFKAITPFAEGGTVRRAGPILVGEERPEVLWANRNEYVQAQLGGIGGGAPLVNVQGNVYGDTHLRKLMNEELAVAEFRQRAAGRR